MNVVPLFETTNPQDNPLDPKTLPRSMDRMVTSTTTLDAYCSLLVQQPDFDLTLLGEGTLTSAITENVKQARKLANRYLNSIHPRVIKSIVDLISVANQFEVVHDMLITLLPNIENDPGNRKIFLQLLDEFIRTLQTARTDTQHTALMLQSLKSELDPILTAIDTDMRKLIEVSGGHSGELADLRNKIKDAEGEHAQKLGDTVGSVFEITGGYVTANLGAGLLVIGTIGLFVAPGGGLALLLAGAPFFLGGAAAFVHGIINESESVAILNENVRKTAALYQQAAELDGKIAALDIVINKLVSTQQVTSGSATAFNDFSADWTSVADQANDYLASLQESLASTDVAYIESTLRIAKSNWADLKARTEVFKERMLMLHPTVIHQDTSTPA